jgi:hypothetical protein
LPLSKAKIRDSVSRSEPRPVLIINAPCFICSIR